MKKFLTLMIASVMMLGMLVGCGKDDTDSSDIKAPEGSTADLIEEVYKKKRPEEFHFENFDLDPADEAMINTFTGLKNGEKIKEVSASEAMGSVAYSLVMIRLNDAADAKTVAKEIKDGINPRKWICVEADDIRVAACGDLVMLFMVSSEHKDVVVAKDMVNAFKDVCGGKLTVDLK